MEQLKNKKQISFMKLEEIVFENLSTDENHRSSTI